AGNRIDLAWQVLNGAAVYVIERSMTGRDGWTEAGQVATGTTTYTDLDLVPGETCYYCIFAYGKKIVASSAVVRATTPTQTPGGNSDSPTGIFTAADIGNVGRPGSTAY